jgi:hypothetical protein
VRRITEISVTERFELPRLVDENIQCRKWIVRELEITESYVRTALQAFVTKLEKAAEDNQLKTKQMLMQIVERVELPEKSETLRVHLSIP